jgi:ankyrin repeat protein
LLAQDDIDINRVVRDSNDTALMLACQNGHHAIVRLLIEREDINTNAANNLGHTALMLSCGLLDSTETRQTIAKLLLGHKNIDINLQDKDGYTALTHACSTEESHDIVKPILARSDVNINTKTRSRPPYNSETALMKACRRGHATVVQLFLSKDINMNVKNGSGYTAFMLAWGFGALDVVKLFLERDDININEKKNLGNTALMFACRSGHEHVVSLLLTRKDLDIWVKDPHGTTALDLAKERNWDSIVAIMEERLRQNSI